MNDIYTWLEEACRSIRYGPDRDAAYRELKDHFQDHYEYLKGQGMLHNDAQKKALEALGDPAETRKLLAAAYHPVLTLLWRISRVLLICLAVAIFASGVIRVFGGESRKWTVFGDLDTEILKTCEISEDSDDKQLTYGRCYGSAQLGEYTFTVTKAVKCRWTVSKDPEDIAYFTVLVLKAKGPMQLETPSDICAYVTAKDDTGAFYDNIRNVINKPGSVQAGCVNMNAYFVRKFSNNYYSIYINNTEPDLRWIDLVYDHMGQSFSLRVVFDQEASK